MTISVGLDIVSSPIGTIKDFRNVEINQKLKSKVLAMHGWKKDYNNPGYWERVTAWPYLSYYEGMKKDYPYIIGCIKRHAQGKNVIMNKDVNLYAGMRVSQSIIDAVMPIAGFERNKDAWERIK